MININGIGRLTADPEVRTTAAGTKYTRFCIADGQEDRAVFIDCAAWGKSGEFVAQYFKKGKPICVSGVLRQHKDEKTGVRYSSIAVDRVDFAPGGGEKKD